MKKSLENSTVARIAFLCLRGITCTPRFLSLIPLRALSVIGLILLFGSRMQAQNAQPINFAWTASPDSTVTGYRIHYGTVSRNYNSTVEAGKNTTAVVSNLAAGVGYYFAVTAYNSAGTESASSNEMAFIAQPLQTGISSVIALSSGAVQLTIIGKAGLSNSVYTSNDLLNWALLNTAVNTTGTLLITDFGASTLSRRFYRMTDATGTSAPAGFIRLPIAGAGSTYAQGMTHIGVGFVNPVSYQGTVSASGAQTLTDLQSHWNPSQFNGDNGEHFIEIVSGSFAGTRSDILSTDPVSQSVKTADDLSAFLKGGESYRIYRHRTIGNVFGKNNEAKLNGGAQISTADEIRTFNPRTQTFLRYYYQTSGTGGIGWRSSTDSSKDVSGTILDLDQGMLICRKILGNLNLFVSGRAKTGQTVVPVEVNSNLIANMYPAGNRTLSNANLYVGNAILGLAGGASVTDADEIRMYNGSTQTAYYYKTSTSGGTGWRSSSNATTDAGATRIPVGSSVFVVRKNGRPAFNWFVPQPW